MQFAPIDRTRFGGLPSLRNSPSTGLIVFLKFGEEYFPSPLLSRESTNTGSRPRAESETTQPDSDIANCSSANHLLQGLP
jgi:hypothetical protein